jgi:DNA ligase (NAD+)
MDKILRIKELVKELNIHRHNYYNLNKPTITDLQYDNMFDELSTLENKTGFILNNSPTQTVGYEVISKLQKVEHPIPLKSLDKTKSLNEINQWRKNQDVLLMLKADGLTNEIIYNNGVLIEGSTRGNSIIGELITHNCKTYKNLPKQIPFKGFLRLAGEAIIHKNDFEKINSKLPNEEKYATPRNLVAGSCRQLNSEICSQREVYFYAFNILECNEELEDSKLERFNWLNNLGLSIIPTLKLTNLENDINDLKTIAEKWGIPIDGIVATFDSVKYSNSLKETAHHPLHSIAYKFVDESQTTQLTGIEWSVGRTGVITPVALFNTVLLDNTEVSRASVHNLSIIEDLELGINDTISIIKANQIIPQIEENYTRSNNLEIPEACPVCGAETIITQLNESKVLYCTNKNCSAKLLKRFSHFVSRDAMNIDGLSEAGIELFIHQGWLKTFDDLYNLQQYKTQIIKLEGWGLKSYNKLISAIEKSRKVKMSNFVYALGIPQIGKGASRIIAKHFKDDFQQFILACKNGFDFSSLTDFGEITNQSIHNWYREKNEAAMWIYLIDKIEVEKEEEKQEVGFKSLEGLTFVVTGNVETFKNRKELEELITSLNGKLSGSVSKKTNYLINNDVTSTSGKNKKAKDLGVEIIAEAMFNELIGR